MSFPARLWTRIRHESFLTVLWPSNRELYRRHDSLRRYALLLFTFNVVVVAIVLHVQRGFVETLFPELSAVGAQFTLKYKVVWYFEGLSRYLLWTAANIPLAKLLRQRYEHPLRQTPTNANWEMGLFFGRIFLISGIVGALLYKFYQRQADWEILYEYLMGRQRVGYMEYRYFGLLANNIFHIILLSCFRAGAVTFALFGGLNIRQALPRAFLAYAIGAFFLFALYHIGEVYLAQTSSGTASGTPWASQPNGNWLPQILYTHRTKMVGLIPYYLFCLAGAIFFFDRVRAWGKKVVEA